MLHMQDCSAIHLDIVLHSLVSLSKRTALDVYKVDRTQYCLAYGPAQHLVHGDHAWGPRMLQIHQSCLCTQYFGHELVDKSINLRRTETLCFFEENYNAVNIRHGSEAANCVKSLQICTARFQDTMKVLGQAFYCQVCYALQINYHIMLMTKLNHIRHLQVAMHQLD